MITLTIIALLVLLAVWAVAWRRSPRLAFGMFIGVGIAWLAVWFARPYLTGQAPFPTWLAPIPVLTVALSLIVLGIVVWVRGNEALPTPPPPKEHSGGHGH